MKMKRQLTKPKLLQSKIIKGGYAKSLLLVFLLFFIVDLQVNAKSHDLTLHSKNFKQEKVQVSGTILDDKSNEPIPGVTVIEKGTTNGAITDVNGNFSLQVQIGSYIEVSSVGYAPQEYKIDSETKLDIRLKLDVIEIESVMVIGYGSVKKSDLTGAVASISSDELKQSIGSGIDQSLQGRSAGINITANSGSPGVAPSVRIRGIGTVTNPNPFFVVDGMPISAEAVGALNPGDIENIEVLKDASAAAIYGARAANGVVLITTKQGKAGKSVVSIDAYTGIQSLVKKYEVLNATDYISIRNRMGRAWEDSSAVPYTDWQEQIFRPAKIKSVQLSLSGGAEKTRFAFISSYFDQEGILKGTDYNRFTSRLNVSSNIKPWLTVGENITLVHSKTSRVPEQNEYTSTIISALLMDPAMEPYDSAGNPVPSSRNNIYNPLGIINRNHNVTEQNKLFGNMYIEVNPIEWLKYRSNFGVDINLSDQEIFVPKYYESVDNSQEINALFNGNYRSRSWLWENTVTINKELGKHNFQALAGYTAQYDAFRQELAVGRDLPENKDLWFVSNAAGTQVYSQFPSSNGTFEGFSVPTIPYDLTIASVLGRIIYSYNSLFDLTGSIRRDGSSRFGDNKRYGIYPSFAAGIKLHELPIIKDISLINFLKVRAGWGKLGNQELGTGISSNYVAYSTITPGFNYNYGPAGGQTLSPGGAPISYSNMDLQWETTVQTNIGLDVNMLENSLVLNADYYIRTTKDMLIEVPVPQISGIQTPPFVNKGSVENKGLELNLSYKKRVNDFSYSINGNIAFVKNKVLSVGDEGEYIESGIFRTLYISRTEAGQPIASFYGYQTDGYWQSQQEIDAANLLAQQTNPDVLPLPYYDKRKTSPGDIKFKDINGDNRITPEDKTYIGSPHPKAIYGINLSLQYKNFDMKLFGQGVYGNKIYMATIYYTESSDLYWNGLTTMNDYWKKEGDNSSVPRLDTKSENDNLRFSDRYVKDGKYFRIKDFQLGYTLSENLTKSLKISSLRVYVSAQNLISFHKYKGFDPEIGIGSDQGSSISGRGGLDIGIDRGMYPIARTFTTGINLSF
jgi:TonB-linked SusC/RagA family outer membrane protein